MGIATTLTSRAEGCSREDGRLQTGGSGPKREEFSPSLLTGRLDLGYSQLCNR